MVQKKIKHRFLFTKIFSLIVVVLASVLVVGFQHRTYATTINTSTSSGAYHCGDTTHGEVFTSINIGCKGVGNPILDMLFAFIRLLSDGVGILIIGSIVVAGIQYTASQGDPNASAAAIKRIRTSLIALLIFIFAYAMLNYVIPAGFFSS
jgi:type IV secretion system pilin